MLRILIFIFIFISINSIEDRVQIQFQIEAEINNIQFPLDILRAIIIWIDTLVDQQWVLQLQLFLSLFEEGVFSLDINLTCNDG